MELANFATFAVSRFVGGHRIVRDLSLVPFSVTCYSDEQLTLLGDMRRGYVVLTIIGPTGDQLRRMQKDPGELYWYKIYASDPVNNNHSRLLGEFFSKIDSIESLAFALTGFRNGAIKHLGMGLRSQLADRIEVPFDGPIIQSAIRVFCCGKDVREYINECWKELAGCEAPSTMRIHVGHRMAIDAMWEAMTKFYGVEEVRMLMPLVTNIVAADKMEEVNYQVYKLLVISSSVSFNSEVDAALSSMNDHCPVALTPPFDFNTFHLPLDTDPCGPLDSTTYFGSYVKQLADILRNNSAGQENRLYRPFFLHQLTTEILPYIPIFTKIMAPTRPAVHTQTTHQPMHSQNLQGRHSSSATAVGMDKCGPLIKRRCAQGHQKQLMHSTGLQASLPSTHQQRSRKQKGHISSSRPLTSEVTGLLRTSNRRTTPSFSSSRCTAPEESGYTSSTAVQGPSCSSGNYERPASIQITHHIPFAMSSPNNGDTFEAPSGSNAQVEDVVAEEDETVDIIGEEP